MGDDTKNVFTNLSKEELQDYLTKNNEFVVLAPFLNVSGQTLFNFSREDLIDSVPQQNKANAIGLFNILHPRKPEVQDHIGLFKFMKQIPPESLIAGSVIDPKGVVWFSELSHPLLIRKCYIDLFGKCEEQKQKGFNVLITGNPGIGKTNFLFYCVLQFVFVQKKTVLFQMVKNSSCWVISPQNILKAQISIDLVKAHEIYLFDAGLPRIEPYDVASTFTIVAASPNRNNYQGYMKDGNKKKFYLPSWSETELSTINNHYGLSEIELSRRLYYYGGIPRYLFCKTVKFGEIDEAIESCTFEQLRTFLFSDASDDAITHKVLLLQTSDYTSRKFEFISDYVKEKLPLQLRKNKYDQTLNLVKFTLQGFPDAAGLRGHLFAELGHYLIASGGEFQTNMGSLSIPPLKTVFLSKNFNNTEKTDLKIGNYIIAQKKNYAVFDSFYLQSSDTLLAFQFTVSSSHTYSEEKVDEFLDRLNFKSVHVYFVVPSDIYESFQIPKINSSDQVLFKLSLWNTNSLVEQRKYCATDIEEKEEESSKVKEDNKQDSPKEDDKQKSSNEDNQEESSEEADKQKSSSEDDTREESLTNKKGKKKKVLHTTQSTLEIPSEATTAVATTQTEKQQNELEKSKSALTIGRKSKQYSKKTDSALEKKKESKIGEKRNRNDKNEEVSAVSKKQGNKNKIIQKHKKTKHNK